MIPLARALAGYGMHPLIPGPPGFGYSDKPRRALSVPEQAALIAQWLAATGCQPARLFGNSVGTQVAAAVAAGHQGTVARLVLLSPAVAPAVRRLMSWLRVLPARAGDSGRRPGRWRVRLLGRLHAALGEDPPLRLLNIAEYGCAGIGEWQQMLGYARRCGRLLAVEPDHYPPALPRPHRFSPRTRQAAPHACRAPARLGDRQGLSGQPCAGP
jgi:pimeloyl-ACP methyl ester carboxylesterase